MISYHITRLLFLYSIILLDNHHTILPHSMPAHAMRSHPPSHPMPICYTFLIISSHHCSVISQSSIVLLLVSSIICILHCPFSLPIHLFVCCFAWRDGAMPYQWLIACMMDIEPLIHPTRVYGGYHICSHRTRHAAAIERESARGWCRVIIWSSGCMGRTSRSVTVCVSMPHSPTN